MNPEPLNSLLLLCGAKSGAIIRGAEDQVKKMEAEGAAQDERVGGG